MAATYLKVTTVEDATRTLAQHDLAERNGRGTFFLAGGTDVVQLMQERVWQPGELVDITALPGMSGIEVGPDGARMGALVTLADAASHAGLRERFRVIGEALLASASVQVRNRATLGGNLLQRTRCGYFRDVVTPCNKREPGSGCPALEGRNRLHAVLGTSEHCIATYAGDLANALLVLDAQVHLAIPGGARSLPLAELFRLPGHTPERETNLEPGELIVALEVAGAATRSHYLKVRDRASFAWALASVAVALDLDEDGAVRQARLAVGGVATTPWRLPHVEQLLLGRRLDRELCLAAGASATDGASARGENGDKLELLRRTVTRALEETGGLR